MALSDNIELRWESMGGRRSALEFNRMKIYGQVLLGFMLICTIQFSEADTNPTDGKVFLSFWVSSIGCSYGLRCDTEEFLEIDLRFSGGPTVLS